MSEAEIREKQISIVIEAIGDLGYDTDVYALREFAEDLLEKLRQAES